MKTRSEDKSSQPIEDDLLAVARAEHQLAEAHTRMDLKTIDLLLHPDYIIIQPGGGMETKDQVIDSYRSGSRHWDTARVDELDILMNGDTAIVVGRWQASGRNGTETFNYAARFLSVWVRQTGRWQNIRYQSTEVESE